MTFDMAEYKRRWRRARRAAGVCYDCGQPSPGFSKCPACRAKEKAALAQASPARKRRRKCLDDASHKAKMEARREVGLCLNCGGPRDNQTLRCTACCRRVKQNQRRRYQRLRDAQRCCWCGTFSGERTYCAKCDAKQKSYYDSLATQLKCHRRRARLKAGGSITKAQWLALVNFCNGTCLRCLARSPEVKVTLDHVVPVIKGGPNTIQNAQPLCARCNKSKNCRPGDYRTPGVRAYVLEEYGNL